MTKYRPDRYFGCISEEFSANLEKFLASEEAQKMFKDDRNSITAEKFRQLMYLKSMRALADPGEAVGVMAAQAIGEPSTQMTLNTFHFAGRTDMNVTLGIPRLREIVMTASKVVSTPMMMLPLLETTPKARKAAAKVAARMIPVTLADVLERVEVVHKQETRSGERLRKYHVKLVLVAPEEYEERCRITRGELMTVVERKFFPQLAAAAIKMLKGGSIAVSAAHVADEEGKEGEGGAAQQPAAAAAEAHEPASEPESEDSEVEGAEEDGTVVASARARRVQGRSYGDEPAPASEDEADGSAPAEEVVIPDAAPLAEVEGLSRKDRIRNVVASASNILDYEYDPQGQWCSVTMQFPCSARRLLFVSIVERLAPKLVIRATRGITNCALGKSSQVRVASCV